MSKIIAVIGATGAQGSSVVAHLLAPSTDGSPSPWRVRALTRDPTHRRAKELEALGAELVQGSFTDSETIHNLFDGVYGAFVNTDSFTVGAAAELHAAFNIWETAQLYKVRHFVWSNLDYSLQLGNYDPKYAVDHHNPKARFGQFLMAQPNPKPEDEGMMWTSFTTGPYMDMLNAFLAPEIYADGTRVFVAPISEKGVVPLVTINDIGWWARYVFDNAPATTGRDVPVASQPATFPEIVAVFKRVTGLPAEFKSLCPDEYFKLWNGQEIPVASAVPGGKTWEANFRAWWAMWGDNLVTRDMDWIKSIHPPTTLDKWMRDNKYDGTPTSALLKNGEDHRTDLYRAVNGKFRYVGF